MNPQEPAATACRPLRIEVLALIHIHVYIHIYIYIYVHTYI